MQRLPVPVVENVQLTTAYATYYSPNAVRATISSATLNNTSGAPVTVSISIVPAAGSQANSNEIVTNLSVPAAGAAPTTLPGLVGQTLMPGETLEMKASAATAITPRISAYETTV